MKSSFSINTLRYLPRQDGGFNGNIGQYQVFTSTDGTNFAVVTAGTWVDDGSEKTAAFTTVSARYVRLRALTEAGNRGPWTSAAAINIYIPGSYIPPPTGLGKWGPTIDFPIVPVAAAINPTNGRILTWSSYAPDTFVNGPGALRKQLRMIRAHSLLAKGRSPTRITTCSVPEYHWTSTDAPSSREEITPTRQASTIHSQTLGFLEPICRSLADTSLLQRVRTGESLPSEALGAVVKVGRMEKSTTRLQTPGLCSLDAQLLQCSLPTLKACTDQIIMRGYSAGRINMYFRQALAKR